MFICDKFRRFLLNRTKKKFEVIIQDLESDMMDDFLELLLSMMQLLFKLNIADYRDQIKNFSGTYSFISKDRRISCAAIFSDEKMKMKRKAVTPADVTVTFKDGAALWDLLMAGSPDVFAFVLERKLSYEGNLNYLLKFAYMSLHLKAVLKI